MDSTLLEKLIAINSGTDNLEGLAALLKVLKEAFAPLGGEMKEIDFQPREVIDGAGKVSKQSVGKGLQIVKHPRVKPRVLLVGHMDTVFPKDSPFQEITKKENHLQGPGAADMKGGLVILLEALKQLEKSEAAGKLGWEVILTSDEEVGSPSSKKFLMERAKEADFGLIFEPSLPDGTLVSARKGSATLSVVVRGKAAHAGREHHLGKSAINALIHFTVDALRLHAPKEGIIINVGHIQGGTGANVVADLAIAKVNVRADHDIEKVVDELKKLAKDEDIKVLVHTMRPPKPFDKRTEALFERLRLVAKEMGEELDWAPSGGVCDGNFLAAAGLPTIDTLGAIGGKIHTDEEYIKLDSLQKRADLVARFLMEEVKR